MNTIQQMSLKLKMGIDPSIQISPEALRVMWSDASARKYGCSMEIRPRSTHPVSSAGHSAGRI